MTQRTKFFGPPAGLGSILVHMSFFMAVRSPVEIFVDDHSNIAFDVKRIWQITDEKLIVTVGKDPGAIPWIPTDELCTYVPYLSSETILLYGREFEVGKTHKPCVALSMHHGGGLGEHLVVKSMPYNKYSTMAEYQEIFQKLCRMGYDVMTINSHDIDVEQKALLLNEFCEFVIGYEGGLHHLAHCLKIPCVVLPWKYNDMGGEPSYPGIYYETHRFHADRKTYFLDSVEEFLDMSEKQIAQLVEDLHDDRGNNILFSPGVTFDPETLKITTPDRDLTPRICWCETYGEQTVRILKEYLPLENMVRYPTI